MDNVFFDFERDEEYDLCSIVEDNVMFEQLCTTLDEVLETLPEIERDIIRKRFGLHDGLNHSLSELSWEYGYTKEHIQIILNRSLWRLRTPERAGRLEGFLEVCD